MAIWFQTQTKLPSHNSTHLNLLQMFQTFFWVNQRVPLLASKEIYFIYHHLLKSSVLEQATKKNSGTEKYFWSEQGEALWDAG